MNFQLKSTAGRAGRQPREGCLYNKAELSNTGSISIKHQTRCYTLTFSRQGWLAAEIVAYLEDVLKAPEPQLAILKLLGYTMAIERATPPRNADHWLEIDLAARFIRTNSGMIRKAVAQLPPSPDDPYTRQSLERLYRFLDNHDFTVEFYP